MKRTIFACLVLLFATPLAAQRLPQTVLPEHYALRFAPDFTKDNFQGEAVITVRVAQPTGSVTLHAVEIEFQQVTITSAGQTQTAKVALQPESETAVFTVDQPVAPGPATIQITFVGQLNDKLRGFYLSKANGRKYAVTQLEATDARRAFPCFDEPAMKATFDVTLTIDAGDTAISNGRILTDTPGPGAGKHTLKFSTTPKMATYLVAMIVGDFECREGAADGIPIRICSTPDKKALTGFALEAAQQELSYYNRYYGIKYPFGKLDVVGVPDFAAGAMENTAAITFREVLLLADPATATLNARKNIAAVMSHEIAHMWFGDLVTMKWWDNLWLNEGFATWAANKPLREWKPEWRTELDDAVATQTALNVDTLQSTRPIRAKMETPQEISEAFDAIAYQKGSAVLQMVEAYVGEDVFRKGVSNYLKRYSYNNATSENFWTEISRASGKPVNEIMASFVEQPGVPLISVESKCEGGSTTVSLAQRRFYFDPALMDGSSPTTWRIPVCMKTTGAAVPRCEVLTAAQQTIKLPGCSPWVFANAGAKGYYRSEYTPAAIEALAPKVTTVLSASERISLVEDEWGLVRTGRHAIGQYLGLAQALAPDPASTIVQTLAGRLAYIGNYLVTDKTREPYQAWIRKTFGPALRVVGWAPAPKEPETTRSLRATLMVLLGVTGRDPEVLQRSRSLAEQYMKDPNSVDATLSVAALAIAAKTGDPALYDQFVAKVRRASGVQEYYRFLNALTEFTEPALVERTLEYALSGDVKSQDAPGLIAGLLSEPDAQRQVWAFVKARWATLDQMLGTFQGIPTVVSGTAAFCEAGVRDDVRQFFETNKVPAAERSLRQALESINNCASLRDRQQANLSNWLAGAAGSSGRP